MLDPTAVPFDYASVDGGAVRDGCEAAMREAEFRLAEMVAVPDAERTLANTLHPLEEIGDLLGQAGGRYGFLSQVSPDAETRQTAHDYEERMDTFASALGFRDDAYRAVRAYADSAEGKSLRGDAARLLQFTLRDFRRNGMDLPAEEREQIQGLKKRLISLGIAFRRNIDEYDDAILVSRDQLAGLPDSYIDRLRREETEEGTRYRVSLDYPEMHPFLESADDASLRETLFRKNHNKAVGTNLALLEEAIGVRDEIAKRLGYESWAGYVIEIRMAKTQQAVLDFLVDLESKVAVKARADMAVLRESKAAHVGGEADVAIWEWRYYAQRVLREKHGVDPFLVAEYFPLEATLDGLFDVYQALVGVRFIPHPEARAWHEDVRFFDIVEEDGERLLGHFYLDLHPRPDKFGHAAAFTLQGGRDLADGSYQAPVSAMVANFTKPMPDSPSLLRHSEVVTLFHEFGHILHQTLTRSRYLRFSGTRVERDFVEAPSQMLEHWCWQPDVLRGFARHYETGEPIPDDLVQRMVSAKNVGSGVATLRQIYFARLDIAYHSAGSPKDSDAIAAELHSITGFPFPPDTHFQAGFGHLFGYDAGYYGYLWSKVFGDDMFTRFEAAGLNDPSVGRDYRRGILEAGGTVDAHALISSFLGREPNSDAFLRDLGLDG